MAKTVDKKKMFLKQTIYYACDKCAAIKDKAEKINLDLPLRWSIFITTNESNKKTYYENYFRYK